MPDVPDSIPAGPLAIERLARAVEKMTETTERRLANIEVLIGKLERNQALMLHEFTGLVKRVAEHEVRITSHDGRIMDHEVRITGLEAVRVRKKRK